MHHADVELEEDEHDRMQRPDASGRGPAHQQAAQRQSQQSRQEGVNSLAYQPAGAGRTPPVRGFFSRSNPGVSAGAHISRPRPPLVPQGRRTVPSAAVRKDPPSRDPAPSAAGAGGTPATDQRRAMSALSPTRSDHSADAAAGAFHRMKARARKAALAKRTSAAAPPPLTDPPRTDDGAQSGAEDGATGLGERLSRVSASSAGGVVRAGTFDSQTASIAPSVETDCVRQNAAIAGLMLGGDMMDFFGPPLSDEGDGDSIFETSRDDCDADGAEHDERGVGIEDEDGPGRIVSPAKGQAPSPLSPAPTEQQNENGGPPALVSPDATVKMSNNRKTEQDDLPGDPNASIEAMERLLMEVADGSVHDDPSLFAASLVSAESGSSSSSSSDGSGGSGSDDSGGVPRRRVDGRPAAVRRRRRQRLEASEELEGTDGRRELSTVVNAPRQLSRLLDHVGDHILRGCGPPGQAAGGALLGPDGPVGGADAHYMSDGIFHVVGTAEEEADPGGSAAVPDREADDDDGGDEFRPLPTSSFDERDAARSRTRRLDTTPLRTNTARGRGAEAVALAMAAAAVTTIGVLPSLDEGCGDDGSFRSGEYESGSGEEYDVGGSSGSGEEYDGDVSGDCNTAGDSMETVDLTRLDASFDTEAAADGTEAVNVSGDTEAAVDGAVCPVTVVEAGARDLPSSSKAGADGEVVDYSAIEDEGDLNSFPGEFKQAGVFRVMDELVR